MIGGGTCERGRGQRSGGRDRRRRSRRLGAVTIARLARGDRQDQEHRHEQPGHRDLRSAKDRTKPAGVRRASVMVGVCRGGDAAPGTRLLVDVDLHEAGAADTLHTDRGARVRDVHAGTSLAGSGRMRAGARVLVAVGPRVVRVVEDPERPACRDRRRYPVAVQRDGRDRVETEGRVVRTGCAAASTVPSAQWVSCGCASTGSDQPFARMVADVVVRVLGRSSTRPAGRPGTGSARPSPAVVFRNPKLYGPVSQPVVVAEVLAVRQDVGS